MSKLLIAIWCSLTALVAGGQTLVMSPGNYEVCAGTLLDPGGNSNYSSNEAFTTTLCPSSANAQLALTIAWSDIRPGDRLCVYDGTTVAAPQLTCSTHWTGGRLAVQATAINSSGCLTLDWVSDASQVGRGFSASIACKPICQPIQAVLAQAEPAASDSATVDLCPGALLTLHAGANFPQNGVAYTQSLASTTFKWTLPDGQERRGRQLQYAYTQPGGYIIELSATDAQGCKSITPLRIRTRVADAPEVSLAATLSDTICAPGTLLLSVDDGPDAAIRGTTPTQFYAPTTSRTDSLPLPDGTGAAHESSIFISQFAEGATLDDVDDLVAVCANMEHSWLRDLSIKLIAPDGRSVVLHNHPGRFGEEAFLGEPIEGDAGDEEPKPGIGYDYCWNNTDPKGDWLSYLNARPAVTTLPAGTYRSYASLDALVGAPLNGAWTMQILDHWEADNGWIFSWSLEFAAGLPVRVDSFQTEIVDIYFQPDAAQSAYAGTEVAYAPTVPGTITPTVTIINDFGCRYDTNFTILVLPENAPQCGPCENTLDTLPPQRVLLGEAIEFNLSTVGSADARYAAVGERIFSFASNPPTQPLQSQLSVLEPPISRLSGSATELVSVCLQLSANDLSELSASLSTPSGEQLLLTQNSLTGPARNDQICFSATGRTDTLASAGDWAQLGGASTAGDWTLTLSDGFGFTDTMRLHQWWLQFSGADALTINSPNDVTQVAPKRWTALPDAHTTYTFRYTDARGCLHTLVFPVVVELPCALSLKQLAFSEPSCAQTADGELLVAAEGNQGPVEYRLGSVVNTTGKFTGLAAGDWLVEARDSASCTASLAGELTAPAGIEVEVASRLTACDPPAYEVELAVVGGPALRDAYWVDAPGLASGFRQNLAPGEYRYRTLDERGCTMFHPISLPAVLALEVGAEPRAPSCADDGDGGLVLNVIGGTAPYEARWSDGFSGLERQNLFAGNYTGVVEDAAGCTASFAVRLQGPPTLSATAEVEANWCANEREGAVALQVTSGSGPFQSRVNGGAWQDGTLLYGLPEGEHSIELRDASACTWSTEVYVPRLSTLPDTLDLAHGDVRYGEPLAIDAAEDKHDIIVRTFWRYYAEGDIACDTCVQTTLTPYASGMLYAIVEDTLGCRIEGTAQLLVRKQEDVFVPTAFRPDGPDANNAILRVHGRSGTVIESFRLFDRWGTQIYESGPSRVNSSRGWDGTYRGQPAQAGVYLYEVTVRDRTGATRRIRGNTTLLR